MNFQLSEEIGLKDLSKEDPVGLEPINKPTLYSIEAHYDCTSGNTITSLQRYKFIQSMNKRCNEVSGEISSFNMTVQMNNEATKRQTISINSTTFVDDYKGIFFYAGSSQFNSF